MRGVAGFTLFRCWPDDVRYLQRWRLTRQRKNLVHGDPGPDRCVAQAGFANRFLHTTGAPNSATLERIPMMLLFRSLISVASTLVERRPRMLTVPRRPLPLSRDRFVSSLATRNRDRHDVRRCFWSNGEPCLCLLRCCELAIMAKD